MTAAAGGHVTGQPVRAARWWPTVIVALAAGALAAAGGADMHVEQVTADAEAGSEASVVVATDAPPLHPASAFRVLHDGVARPVAVVDLPPGEVEVVIVVDTSETAPQPAVRSAKSAVIDLMLRLELGVRVSLVDTGAPPEVLTVAGTGMQGRLVAASRLERGGAPSLGPAAALALQQFSDHPDTVRALVVAGAVPPGEDPPDELVEGSRRHGATVHLLRPEASAGDRDALQPVVEETGGLVATAGVPESVARLAGRLSNLYRLSFAVPDPEAAVVLRFRDTEAAIPVPQGGDGGGDGVATPADTPAAGIPWWPDRLPALVVAAAAGTVVLLTAGVAFGAVRRRPDADAPGAEVPAAAPARAAPVPADLDAAVRRVARETGAASAALAGPAGGIAAQRRQAAAGIRAAGLEGRLAAAALTASPPVVVVAWTLLFQDGRFDELVAGAASLAALLGATVLTVVGGLWLHRATRPPFTPWPARWRAHDRRVAAEDEAARALDLACLYAAAGLERREALARAGASDPGPGQTPAAAVAALRAGQVERARRQAAAVPVATLGPFVICIVPATVLFLVAGWAGAGGR